MKEKIKLIKSKIVYFLKNTPKKRLYIYFGLFLLCIPTFYGFATFSRYVFKNTYNNYLISKEFYFYSDSLNDDLTIPEYTLEDWDGESNYTLNFDIKNYIDELRWTKKNVNYTITTTCDPNISGEVTCTSNNGTIVASQTGGTKINVNVVLANDGANGEPLVFEEGDYVDIDIIVRSTEPYSKTIRAKFRVSVELQNVKYLINDISNQPYFDFYISNYSDVSKTIALGWDYTLVNVDNTNTLISNGVSRTTTVSGVRHLNGSTITLGARKSAAIRFYKKTPSNNYTYPITNNTSIITVSAS